MTGEDTMRDETTPCGGHGRAATRVDMWLRTSLASRFDTVLHEKLPDDWLRMIGAAGTNGRDR
jgi:hypothetical protein